MINKKIVIEIRGIGFPNKGAELMMLAIMEHFKGQDIHWCMAPKNDFIHRMSYPLWQKAEIIFKGINIAAPISLLPWKLRRFFGLVNESEVDYIFDASGFAYGDQWGINNTQKLADNIEKWKKQNKKVILFPQAFGPFTNTVNASLMKKICDHADLIFARDKDSFNALKAISNRNTISLNPDFTPSLKVNNHIADALKDKVCFIPNSKMLSKGDALEKQFYLDFFVGLINLAIEQNQQVILLSHDGQRDEKLIDAIQQKLTSKVPSFYIDSALELKQTISQSKVVISSRFHGLVSALSNGIPVIATGWSHKYQNLLTDYACEDALFRSSEIGAAKKELINLMTNPDYYASRQQLLLHCQKNHDIAISQMWIKVEQQLFASK
jgi:exopolysaccharide biosynthesis predicted pyruvyltransferase EpsI